VLCKINYNSFLGALAPIIFVTQPQTLLAL